MYLSQVAQSLNLSSRSRSRLNLSSQPRLKLVSQTPCSNVLVSRLFCIQVRDLPLSGRLQCPQTFYHNLPSDSIPWNNCNSKLSASCACAAISVSVDVRMYSALFDCHCELMIVMHPCLRIAQLICWASRSRDPDLPTVNRRVGELVTP
jgi:hypothetical protein